MLYPVLFRVCIVQCICSEKNYEKKIESIYIHIPLLRRTLNVLVLRGLCKILYDWK